MTHIRIVQLALVSLIVVGIASAKSIRAESSPAKPTIVLVHGAFADGTSWQHVIPILEHDGYTTIAVQNPLASLAGDVETTKRVIDAQQGPVIAVGHSYGGAVITGAATGNTNVKALVYIAAFAPDSGEPIDAFSKKYPSELGAALRPDAAGFLTIDRKQFRDLFARDVSETQASVMAATQKPIHRQRIWRVRGAAGVEDHSLMVPGHAGGPGH